MEQLIAAATAAGVPNPEAFALEVMRALWRFALRDELARLLLMLVGGAPRA
jgi:hypothetical protein